MSVVEARRRKIAGILRGARNMMNHNGDHWTQGVEVDTVATRYNEAGVGTGYQTIIHPEDGKETYCSIGGIAHVKIKGHGRITDDDRRMAMIELAEVISPGFKKYLEDIKDDFVDFRTGERDEWGWQHFVDESVTGIIAFFNDEPGRKWEEIKEVFTKAARRLR